MLHVIQYCVPHVCDLRRCGRADGFVAGRSAAAVDACGARGMYVETRRAAKITPSRKYEPPHGSYGQQKVELNFGGGKTSTQVEP
jgi:hypothetical protein